MTPKLLHQVEIRIAGLYVFIAAIWVLMSDALLFSLLPESSPLAPFLSLIKGIGFVVVTGIALYILLKREFARRDAITRAHKEQESSFRLLFESNPHPMWVYDIRTLAFLEINHAAIEHYGYSRSEFLSMTLLDIRLEQDHQRLVEDVRQQRPALQKSGIWQHRLKNGQIVDVEITSHTLEYAGNHAALVMAQDITERRRAETALRESEERFRQLAEHIKQVFFLNDADKRQVLYISPAYEEIWGRSCESLYKDSRSFLEAIHPDDRAQVVASFAQQREGHQVEVNYRVIRPDNSMRWIRSKTFPVFDDNGTLKRIAGVAEDVTRYREQEDQLKRMAQQLVHIQEMERRDIARELHDEIGQTLTGLSLSLEMLLRRQQIEQSDEAAHIQHIVASLMKQVREMSLDLRPAMLDDLGLLPALRWLFNRYTARTGIFVEFQQHGADQRFSPEVETTVYRIIQESLTNVARHAGVNSVMVDLQTNDEHIVIQIEDRGKGFDVEKARSAMATGGLIGMHERAFILGGTLNIDSTIDQGTHIIAEIPLERLESGETPS